MPRSLYLIDGLSQIFRAYYAPFGNLSSPTGEPTRATHVFCQMLLNLLKKRKPDYLAVAMEGGDESTFRREIEPEYKAHRDAAPEDLGPQIDRIVHILKAAKVPIVSCPRFEADDVLATLATRFAGEECRVVLVSRDKDLDQLLNENITLYDPLKDEEITPDKLVQAKGWTPEQAVDAQTLIGDSVDNVRGVAGIGPKTAAKLLQKYGTAKAVIEHADELSPKQRESVLAFAPQLEHTRKLVTLVRDAPVEFNLDDADCTGFDWAAARPLFQELGFRRLIEQWPGAARSNHGNDAGTFGVAEAPAARAPAGLASRSDEPPAESVTRGREGLATRYADFAQPLREPDGGAYRLVTDPDALADVCAALDAAEAFAVDTETTGLHPIDAECVGISLAWEAGSAAYIPLKSALESTLAPQRVFESLRPRFADPSKTKIGHNLKFDLLVLQQAQAPIRGTLFDTMVAAFVLDPIQLSYGLDKLVQGMFGRAMIPISDLIGKGRDQLRMDQVPLSQVCVYAGEDADYTWRLWRVLSQALDRSPLHALFHETEMPLLGVLARMEHHGVTIDVELLARMSKELARRADELLESAQSAADVRFNPDSPKQLAEVLFDKLGLRVVRHTKTARSTDAETLEALAEETDNPLPRILLEYREVQKLRGTYVDALPLSRSRRTGRVHTSFHQTGAITGRLSSSDPNLQNIPIRTELGRAIRAAFIPRSDADRLIVADYSQIELRVLAHFCQDPGLLRAFAEDLDIHTFVAAEINGVALDQVTREMRGKAKAVNFGLIYGQTAFGLAQGTGMSRSDAQDFIQRYFARYPRIRAFIDECIATARREGSVTTLLGRVRPIWDIESRNRSARAQAERLAVNTVIQGSAADLIKTAMVQLDARITQESLPLRLLLQVHDELVCEAPADRADPLAHLVSEVMRSALPLRVPLKVDVAVGQNWLEAK